MRFNIYLKNIDYLIISDLFFSFIIDFLLFKDKNIFIIYLCNIDK